MSMQWISFPSVNPYSEWPITFAGANAPPGTTPVGAFFFLSGQFQRNSPGMFGIDIVLNGNVLGTAWAYVDATEGYQLINEVLVPISPIAPSYEIGLQPHPGPLTFGQLTPECSMSGTLVTLFGPQGLGQIQTANARASSNPPIEASVGIPPAGPAIDAFMLLSGQVLHLQSAPGETILQVDSPSGSGTSQGYAAISSQSPMAPFLLAAEQLPPDGQYQALFSTPTPGIVGATSSQTASVVELEQPDR